MKVPMLTLFSLAMMYSRCLRCRCFFKPPNLLTDIHAQTCLDCHACTDMHSLTAISSHAFTGMRNNMHSLTAISSHAFTGMHNNMHLLTCCNCCGAVAAGGTRSSKHTTSMPWGFPLQGVTCTPCSRSASWPASPLFVLPKANFTKSQFNLNCCCFTHPDLGTIDVDSVLVHYQPSFCLMLPTVA